ncbi:MAG: glycosyltransferase [Anaerolineae bacterium]|nr:glycosyltransferase [Anaerolineae bacterium]
MDSSSSAAEQKRCDVLMLVLNDVSFDGRVRAEAAALAAAGWRVLVIGTQRADGSLPDHELIQGFELWRVRYGRVGRGLHRPWRWLRHVFQAAYILRALARIKTRAYHAHDLPALLLLSVVRLFRRPARLVYDAHELYLFQARYTSRLARGWHRLTRPLFMRLEGFLARRADAVLALSEERARLLARWYGIPRPVVIQNALDPVPDNTPAPVDLRTVIGAGRRIVVHTGFIDDRRRALTELVQAMARLPEDVALVFLGRGDAAKALRALAGRLGIQDRVLFVPPVMPEQVAMTIRAADVAAVLMRTGSLNTRAAPPNKLYEAIAAGVPVVATELPVLRRFVVRYELGALCDPADPDSIAGALRRVLSPDGQRDYRARVREAQQVFNWQAEVKKLHAVYREVLA